MTKVLAIIGAQRSGTTAIARTLASLGNTSYFGEVFHCDPSEMIRNSNYFHWYSEYTRQTGAAQNHFFDYQTTEFHCKQFLQHLVSIGNANNSDFITIDLKYTIFNFIEWPWCEPFQRPTLLNTLLELFDSYIIHISRANLVDQYFSKLRAESSCVWHENENKNHTFHVDKYELEDYIFCSLQTSSRFSHLLSRTPKDRVAEITYEESFEPINNSLSVKAMNSLNHIFDQLQILPTTIQIPIKKSITATIFIENLGEVYAYFEGGEYEHYFESSKAMGGCWHIYK